jgi:hypothetical protein
MMSQRNAGREVAPEQHTAGYVGPTILHVVDDCFANGSG